MPETYEIDGIIYFTEPYKTDFWEWIDEHIGVDTLFIKNPVELDKDIIRVVAYAKDKSYNKELSLINKSRQDTTLVRGVPEEVYSIDSIQVQ